MSNSARAQKDLDVPPEAYSVSWCLVQASLAFWWATQWVHRNLVLQGLCKRNPCQMTYHKPTRDVSGAAPPKKVWKHHESELCENTGFSSPHDLTIDLWYWQYHLIEKIVFLWCSEIAQTIFGGFVLQLWCLKFWMTPEFCCHMVRIVLFINGTDSWTSPSWNGSSSTHLLLIKLSCLNARRKTQVNP